MSFVQYAILLRPRTFSPHRPIESAVEVAGLAMPIVNSGDWARAGRYMLWAGDASDAESWIRNCRDQCTVVELAPGWVDTDPHAPYYGLVYARLAEGWSVRRMRLASLEELRSLARLRAPRHVWKALCSPYLRLPDVTARILVKGKPLGSVWETDWRSLLVSDCHGFAAGVSISIDGIDLELASGLRSLRAPALELSKGTAGVDMSLTADLRGQYDWKFRRYLEDLGRIIEDRGGILLSAGGDGLVAAFSDGVPCGSVCAWCASDRYGFLSSATWLDRAGVGPESLDSEIWRRQAVMRGCVGGPGLTGSCFHGSVPSRSQLGVLNARAGKGHERARSALSFWRD